MLRSTSETIMKTTFTSVLAVVLSLTLCHAQLKSPLRITVDKAQKTKQDIKQQGRATQSGDMIYHTPQVTERNREVVMNIKLQNLGGSALTGLTVKYVIFSRDKQTRAIRPVGQGERTADIKPVQTVTVKTDPVDFESRDTNYTQGEFAEMNRSTGKDYYGIAVTVYLGEEKIASYCNPPSLDKILVKMESEKQDTGTSGSK